MISQIGGKNWSVTKHRKRKTHPRVPPTYSPENQAHSHRDCILNVGPVGCRRHRSTGTRGLLDKVKGCEGTNRYGGHLRPPDLERMVGLEP